MTVPVDLTIQLYDLPALCARQETSTIALTQDDLNAVRSVTRDGTKDVAGEGRRGSASLRGTVFAKRDACYEAGQDLLVLGKMLANR